MQWLSLDFSMTAKQRKYPLRGNEEQHFGLRRSRPQVSHCLLGRSPPKTTHKHRGSSVGGSCTEVKEPAKQRDAKPAGTASGSICEEWISD